eukprot:scaffold11248_cov60-Cylindrotheca_fusiformis.AAC.4
MTAVKVENSNDRLMPNKGMPLSPPLSPTTTTTIAGQSLKPSSLTYSPTSTPTKNKTTTDLLTDRNGILSDLKYDELKQSMQQQQQRRSFPMLLSFLPERVGDVDDLLEDGHAFSDICSSSSSSSSCCSSLSASHHPSTEPALEPLVEIDEEEQHVISDDMGDASGSIPPLHLHARNGHHAEMSLSNSKLNNENDDDDDDDDILTDRLGMQDLNYNDMHQQQIVMHHRPSLVITERMCEESLDDCHAFSDLKMTRSFSSSNKSTTTTFSPVLIPSNGTSSGTSSVLTLPPLEEEKEDVEVCELDVVVQAKE